MDRDYALSYQRLYREHWWWRAREQYLLDVIDSLDFPRGASVLDFGCGGGWSFEVLQRYGEVYGIEFDETLVELAGDRQSRIHRGTLDDQFQPPCKFALIVMLDVIEHLADPEVALRRAIELLEPDGRIVITVPAFPMFWTAHDEINRHFLRYTQSSMDDLARRTGLHLERSEYFFHWTAPLKLTVRIKEALFGAKRESPAIPPAWINQALIHLSRWEQRSLGKLGLPIGTSLLCVAKGPRQSG